MFYFSKMQGTGNDFIIIDYTKNKFQYSLKRLAEFLCDRHYGVGADGILIVDKSENLDFKMRIFNSDGTEAEMCGNGIRCFSKYVYENRLTNKKNLKIETISGIKDIKLNIEDDKVVSVKVNMGKPEFEYDKIPVIYNECKDKLNKEMKNKLEGKEILIDDKKFYAISMGNPHAVCFCENIENLNLQELGPKIENYKFFPNKTNVEFVQIINKEKIKVRVWERGVGETYSCGTGACAAAVISNIIKSTNSEISVHLKGGILKVNYDNINEKIFLEGEAEEVFKGKLNI